MSRTWAVRKGMAGQGRRLYGVLAVVIWVRGLRRWVIVGGGLPERNDECLVEWSRALGAARLTWAISVVAVPVAVLLPIVIVYQADGWQ